MKEISVRITFGIAISVIAIAALYIGEKEIAALCIGGMLTYINPKAAP